MAFVGHDHLPRNIQTDLNFCQQLQKQFQNHWYDIFVNCQDYDRASIYAAKSLWESATLDLKTKWLFDQTFMDIPSLRKWFVSQSQLGTFYNPHWIAIDTQLEREEIEYLWNSYINFYMNISRVTKVSMATFNWKRDSNLVLADLVGVARNREKYLVKFINDSVDKIKEDNIDPKDLNPLDSTFAVSQVAALTDLSLNTDDNGMDSILYQFKSLKLCENQNEQIANLVKLNQETIQLLQLDQKTNESRVESSDNINNNHQNATGPTRHTNLSDSVTTNFFEQLQNQIQDLPIQSNITNGNTTNNNSTNNSTNNNSNQQIRTTQQQLTDIQQQLQRLQQQMQNNNPNNNSNLNNSNILQNQVQNNNNHA